MTEAPGNYVTVDNRGYNNGVVRRQVADAGIRHIVAPEKRHPVLGGEKVTVHVPLGRRWVVERTHSWLSNYGQLRRNTDRRIAHRLAQLALAIAVLLIARLFDRGFLAAA